MSASAWGRAFGWLPGVRGLLQRAALERVKRYLLAEQREDGGFGRPGAGSDLYYTVFGVELLEALGVAEGVEAARAYVTRHPLPTDFVHLCCLCRLHQPLALTPPPALTETLKRFLTPDGGAHRNPTSERASIYDTFLYWSSEPQIQRLFQEKNTPRPPAPDPRLPRFAAQLKAYRTPDGGYASLPLESATTSVTAAALLLETLVAPPAPPQPRAWLRARFGSFGGATASAATPVPDLLSTATALHALAQAGEDLAPLREGALDFTSALWDEDGGFAPTPLDGTTDVEYTFYGLLALKTLMGGGNV